MENNIELFHGSNVIVENPKVLISGFYKDFGYGFYRKAPKTTVPCDCGCKELNLQLFFVLI